MTEEPQTWRRCTACGVSDRFYPFHQKCSQCTYCCVCGRSRVEVAAIRTARAIDAVLVALGELLHRARAMFSRCQDCRRRLQGHERDYPTCDACWGEPRKDDAT
jgi:hypothetical protein